MSEEFGDIGPLLLQGGLVLNTLTALAIPGDTALIGREVIASTATSHYLVQPRTEELSFPVEVWVADNGLLVQIRYLASSAQGEPVEITAVIGTGTSSDLDLFPQAERAVTIDELAAEERSEQDRQANAAAEAEEAASNPLSGDDVSVDDIAAALDRRVALDEIFDGVFALAEVDQLCVGVDDFLEAGTQHNVTCRPIPSAQLQAALCPTVADFALVSRNAASRAQIAIAAASMMKSLDGLSEQGLETIWQSTPPTSMLEPQKSGGVDLSMAAVTAHIAEFWAMASGLDGPSAVFIGNQHSLLAAVCAFDPAYNTALVQKQPPLDAVPDPTTPTTSQEADPLLALLPMSVGAEGDAVQSIQRLLIIAGESLYPDGADSRFGPGTEARVATFQTRNGLPASGVVDEQTLLLLRGIERSSGSASPAPGDPTCPTIDQAQTMAADIDAHTSSSRVRYLLCSGRWATARHLFTGNDFETVMLMAYENSQWTFQELAAPEFACTTVPPEHRAALGC